MARSVVDCCNGALQRIGEGRILALSDNTKAARECSVAYEGARRAEIRKYRWNFAVTRIQLAPDATAPAFGFTYQYPLPADCLRILMPSEATLDWVLEGGKILTKDGPVLNLRYLADITDPTLWDAAFYDLMTVAIALSIVEAITNSPSKKNLLDRDYKDMLNAARAVNAFEQIAGEPIECSFVRARF